MNRSTLVSAAAVALLTLSAPLAQAQESPNTPEKRAAEAAKQGPEQLRRFVNRTRMVYGLNFSDYYKPE